MPTVLPDPDTIRYPLHDATLILSVSEDPFAPQTGVKPNTDIYCENFQLDKDISGTNSDDKSPVRFGLFTHNFLGRGGGAKPLSISLSGAEGKDHDNPNGHRGGIIEIYIEDLSVDAARGLKLEARGGRGYKPLDKLDAKVGDNGGNGGDGGDVSVLVGDKTSNDANIADRILDHLAGSPPAKWPGDFKGDIAGFIEIVEKKEVKAIYQPPSNMRTAEDIGKASLPEFRAQVRRLQRALGPPIDDVHVVISNAIDVHGGEYGTGSSGTEKSGTSGQAGKDHKPLVKSTGDIDALFQTNICYAHPIQCRLLLDKAKQLFWSGSLENKALSVTILQRLQKKLGPFLTMSSQAFSPSLAKLPLVQAYRDAEPRLYIVSDKDADIPVSIKRLTTLTAEAESTLHHILTGVDFYGKSPDEVPRRSFIHYHDTAEYFLNELELIENTYKDWFNDGSDASAKLKAIRSRGSLCDKTADLKRQLINEAIIDMDISATTIQSLTEAIPAARKAVMDEVEKVVEEIKKKFTFSFDDLVSALSQVLFVHGDPSMTALQTIGLVDKGLNKIEKDDGIQVPKTYLLSKLHKIDGSFESLDEGYKVLKDWKAELTDPGAEKLLIAEKDLEKLLNDFATALGDDVLKGVKAKFEAYIGIVSQRNEAVVRYNSDLTLLFQYHRELDSLAVEKADLVRDEYEKLGTDHPSMTAFMKRTNEDAVQKAQLWLYKQERAYNFIALSEVNIIGEALKDVPVSQYSLVHLRKAQAALWNYWNMVYEEKKNQAPGVYSGAKFPLDRDDVEDIRDSGKKGIILLVNVPRTASIFNGKADVRLTKVRFIAPGAKTDDQRLEVKITHSGTEKIYDSHSKEFPFKHDSLKITFRYNTLTGKAKGDDVIDGIVSWPEKNDFALPGPFTQWKIEIRSTTNKGLDLSGVKSACMEFDFQFETV